MVRLAKYVFVSALLGGLSAPAFATLTFLTIKPSRQSPQPIGTAITWIVTATDTNPGPLTFQFSVAPPGGSQAMVVDFNIGTLNSGTWTSLPFAWVPTGIEGTYKIQVVIKDFKSGESASKTVTYQVNSLVTGSAPVVVPTTNPLVALFSAPSCNTGSSMRVQFQPQSKTTPGTITNWANCHPPNTMTFEIAGMYPSTTYQMFSQTVTLGKIVNGPTITFTTGAVPHNVPIPPLSVLVPPGPQTDTVDGIILHNLIQLGQGTHYPDIATDLSGNLLWYFYSSDVTHTNIITRPLPNGNLLTIQNGPAWNPVTQQQQLLRQIDFAGNVIRETNTGVVQQELLALGATDGGPCSGFTSPPPVGTACLGSFHHDAIQTLPNGYTAVIADVEKIFPPGTQGDTTGLPVDVIGDMILVLDKNWQVVWYFDTFQHASGPPQLNINRAAVLGETCVTNQLGCPPVLLVTSGISPKATDWLHANSLYYSPQDGNIIWSSRHQDWIMKVAYRNGTGTANILWRMGLNGDFAFNNIYNDPYPWFSHQHDAGIENGGTGVMTIFDNGNTRVAPPPVGLGSGNSRGMALTVNESGLQVTPVLSSDLGVYSIAMGSAQLLYNGNYFFQPAYVLINLNLVNSYGIEIFPTAGTATGTQVLNLLAPESYRAWQMSSFYAVPTT